MDFQTVVRKRRMVRAFLDRPIPRAAIDRILANAQRGPSSGFTQGFEFLVFDGPDETKRFWEATPWLKVGFLDGARVAPLILVPVAHSRAYVERYLSADKVAVGRRSADDFPAPYWFIDSGMASMLVLLTAIDEGLGAFYFSIGPTSREIPQFRSALGVPETYWPIGAIAIGYAAPQDPASPPRDAIRERRRAPDSMLHRGGW